MRNVQPVEMGLWAGLLAPPLSGALSFAESPSPRGALSVMGSPCAVGSSARSL